MEFFYGTTAAAIESMYCQLLQEKRAIHAHRDVLAWNQNIRFEKKDQQHAAFTTLMHIKNVWQKSAGHQKPLCWNQ